MSRLNELVKELCPNGVEYKKLGDIEELGLIKLGRGNVISKTDIRECPGNYPIYSSSATGNGEFGRYGKYMFDYSQISWSIDGGGRFFLRKDDKYSLTNVSGWLRVLDDKVINIDYLYYVLTNEWQNKTFDYTHKAHPSVIRDEYIVPLPPLKIQQEIVKILDKFTELQAELQAELDLRLKQYEYYRDELLSFDKLNNLAGVVRRVRLGEVAKYSVARISTDLVDDSTYVGVDNLLPDKRGKINSSHVPTAGYLTKFVAGDVLIGNIRPYLRKIWLADIDGGTNGDVLSIHVVDKLLNSRFLYYVLSSERFFTYSVNNSKGAKMPRGDRRSIMEYEFTIPSLNAQQKIVEVLDRFSSITTSLTNGLPAEIKLRQQQYEYYRDELLSFKLTNV